MSDEGKVIGDQALAEWLCRRGRKYPQWSAPNTVGPMMNRAGIRILHLSSIILEHINTIRELDIEIEKLREANRGVTQSCSQCGVLARRIKTLETALEGFTVGASNGERLDISPEAWVRFSVRGSAVDVAHEALEAGDG